jgi:GNAT superfamily N-acetyltransferase
MAPTILQAEPSVRLVPASQFTIEALTSAYNQTRVDYLVPMPMNAARLAAYVRIYDVDMEHSWVALEGEQMLGLAMLGVRPGRTWVTRLGVLPARRRHGAGEALVNALLQSTRDLGRPLSILEVIQGNAPAHMLFRKVGFRETRGLLVMRRPPGQPARAPRGIAAWLEGPEALDLLCTHPVRPAWTNELESYINAGDVQALQVEGGWLAFRRQKLLLSHFVFHTSQGSPEEVAEELIAHLYARFPTIDTHTENLPAGDPHLPALLRMGFLEIFRRVEMHWPAAQAATGQMP